ncbi:hypothetical protein THMIRHAS_07360 [Thiosulfatimonas sediminis]|uniref:Uncharacterized protein n=1 Tax=Thiosulfatimonas sediminis TaxID=2675054 RepID=A0A6F8PTA3_9GAMM|nr:hypothetical protein [Thiosulfatimonas sediminis]BBP45363.1 hypothetical protein THMIRHAS_07360 [Thiosulfatimonas sediminis]
MTPSNANPNAKLSDAKNAKTVALPTPDELLQRLQQVDCSRFDVDKRMNEMRGNRIWFSAMAIPVSAVFLTIFTLIGAFAFDQPIPSFLISAAILYWIGTLIDSQQRHLPIQARNEIMQLIAETEGEQGLVPHFSYFLPKRYRHLWQSLKKGNYHYIEQYIQAITLLQKSLDANKFIQFWYLKHPQQAEPETTEDHPFAEVVNKAKKSA